MQGIVAAMSCRRTNEHEDDAVQRDGVQQGNAKVSGEADTLAMIAHAMCASGRYRLVERFERRARYAADDGAKTRTALFVDVETTGLVPAADSIIQLACVPFEYNPTDGRIYTVGGCLVYLEEPGVLIRQEITDLTGITQADVIGKRIDDEAVERLLTGASLVIAHNASFDRRFLERRLPAFAAKPWACSRDDVPWAGEGFSSTKLEWLAYKQCGMFYDAHRADSDCYMAVHLLTTTLPSGRLALAALLESSRRRTVRIWAVAAPFVAKERLKLRHYRWSDGEDGRPKAWWREVPETDAEAEMAWLRRVVYHNGPCPAVVEVYDARSRYSDRTAAA